MVSCRHRTGQRMLVRDGDCSSHRFEGVLPSMYGRLSAPRAPYGSLLAIIKTSTTSTAARIRGAYESRTRGNRSTLSERAPSQETEPQHLASRH